MCRKCGCLDGTNKAYRQAVQKTTVLEKVMKGSKVITLRERRLDPPLTNYIRNRQSVTRLTGSDVKNLRHYSHLDNT